jgi:hypothetical protein
METDKIVESVKFLLTSVRRLSDHLLETEEVNRVAMQHIWDTGINTVRDDLTKTKQQIDAIILRLAHIENDEQVYRDHAATGADATQSPGDYKAEDRPIAQSILPLNLTDESILEIYRNSPSLLQPFARSCSISARTLSGMITEVEIEIFAQGTSWIIETIDGEWLLIPRPGLLSRASQYQSLERLFEIEKHAKLPAELELLKPGLASVVEHGRRWFLTSKGSVGLQPDPLKHSLERRLRILESRLKILEDT